MRPARHQIAALNQKDVMYWTAEEVGHWLRLLRFDLFVQRFYDEAITGEALLYLCNDDLEELGVHSLADREDLTSRIRLLQSGFSVDVHETTLCDLRTNERTEDPTTMSDVSSVDAYSYDEVRSALSGVTPDSAVLFKCTFRNRKKLVKLDMPVTFRKLHRRLREEYGTNVTLKYVDSDGDKFVVSNDRDLETIIATFTQPLTIQARKRQRRSKRSSSGSGSLTSESVVLHGNSSDSRSSSSSSVDRRRFDMLDTLVDSCVVCDERGVIVFFSRAAERLWGFSRDEVIGLNVSVLAQDFALALQVDSSPRELTPVSSTVKTRVIGNGRKMVATAKDGSRFEVFTSASESVTNGRRSFTATCKDIAAFKEQSFPAHERHDVLDAIDNAALVFDDSGRIEFVNRSLRELFCFDIGELVGRDVKVLMPRENRYCDDENDNRQRSSSETTAIGAVGQSRDVLAQHKDGHMFPVCVSISENKRRTNSRSFTAILRPLVSESDDECLVDEDGLTPRGTRRISGELPPLEVHRVTLESLGVAAVVLDRKSRVQVWTSLAERMLGYSASAVLGRRVSHIFPELEAFVRDEARAPSAGCGMTVVTKDHQRLLALVSVSDQTLAKDLKVHTAIMQAIQ